MNTKTNATQTTAAANAPEVTKTTPPNGGVSLGRRNQRPTKPGVQQQRGYVPTSKGPLPMPETKAEVKVDPAVVEEAPAPEVVELDLDQLAAKMSAVIIAAAVEIGRAHV